MAPQDGDRYPFRILIDAVKHDRIASYPHLVEQLPHGQSRPECVTHQWPPDRIIHTLHRDITIDGRPAQEGAVIQLERMANETITYEFPGRGTDLRVLEHLVHDI